MLFRYILIFEFLSHINGKLCRHFKCDLFLTVIRYAAALYIQLCLDCVFIHYGLRDRAALLYH